MSFGRQKFSRGWWAVGLFLAMPAIGLAIAVNSFELPVKSTGAVAFNLDVCQFESPDGPPVVELAYSMDLQQFLPAGDTADSIRFDVQWTFLDTQSRVVNDINERKSLPYDRLEAGSEDLTFIDLKKFLITVDTLQIRLEISSPLTARSGKVHTAVAARKFSGRLSLSDILFISRIQRTHEHTPFMRHGLTMIPNPSRFYRADGDAAEAPVYFEINNLSYDAQTPSVYSVDYNVSSLAGKEIITNSHAALSVKSSNSSRVEKIDLRDLEAGVYRLTLRVVDLSSGDNAAAKRYFKVHAAGEPAALLLPMTKADVKKYLDQIKFIASRAEIKMFHDLDAAGKQAFLLQFWKSRDPVPQTAENEFMEEYFAKIAYCDDNFENGINSDRGRIFMTYGAPLDIQRERLAARSSQPVEIWTYAIEGTTEFIFVDRMGGDQYVLVH